MKRTLSFCGKYACLLLLVLMAACKKETNSTLSKDSSGSSSKTNKDVATPGLSIPLTREEAAILKEWMKQNKGLRPADVTAKVYSIKSMTAQNKSGNGTASTARTADAPDYSPGADDFENYFEAGGESNTFVEFDLIEGHIVYKARIQQNLQFTIRQNTVLVIVPYIYHWKPGSGNQWYVSRVLQDPMQPPKILPTGAFWGEVTQVTYGYVNGGIGDELWCPVNASGGAEEKRTLITSTTGAMKVSTNLNLEVFEAGAEIEAGFTIQSASYTYNQYTMEAEGRIFPTGYGISGQTRFAGTVKCTQYGVLKNQ